MALQFLNNGYFAGKVGIGTASPAEKLHIVGDGDRLEISSADYDLIKIGAFGTSGADIDNGFLNLSLNGSEKIRLLANGTSYFNGGNVGIGTASPAEKLEVSGGHIKITNAGNTNLYINANASNADATIFFEESDSVKAKIQHDASNDSMLFTDGAYTDTMTLKGGKVGIGTDDPDRPLHVNGGSLNFVAEFESTDDKASILIQDDDTLNYIHSQDGYLSLGGQNALNAGNLNINSSNGNVGIGTTSPDTKLEIVGNNPILTIRDSDTSTSTATSTIRFAESNANDTLGNYWDVGYSPVNLLNFDFNGSTKMTINSSGDVGIGTDDPSRKLQVKGTSNTAIAITSSTSNLAQLALGDTDDDNYAQILLDNSSNKLQIQNGGGGIISNRGITLDSSENVGIGTDSPTSPLTIKSNSTSSSSSGLTIQSNGNTNNIFELAEKSTDGARLQMMDAGVTKIALYTDGTNNYINAGNVGIGTSSPDTKLNINGNSGDPSTTYTTTAANSIIGIGNFGASGLRMMFGVNPSTPSIWIQGQYTTNQVTAKLLLNPLGGNVGIGTLLPLAKFVVKQTDAELDVTTGSDNVSFECLDRANTNNGIDMRYYARNGNYQFFTGTYSERMRITNAGNVGIGEANPSFKLDVITTSSRARFKAVTGDANIELSSIAGHDYLIQSKSDDSFVIYDEDASSARLTINGSGNATFAGTVSAPTFFGDLNGTINTVTTATTKGNATNDTTVATTAFVQNVVGTIPAGLVFQGTWNADTNTPTLTSGSGTTGNFYIVSVAGSTNLDGITDWQVGDWAVFIEQGASDQWEKIDNSSVLGGSGTGGTIAGWSGSGTSVTLGNAPVTFSGNDSSFAGDVTVTGGDLTLGTDSIASNINGVGDVLNINVDSNTGGGAGANIQLKTAGNTQLTINSSSSTFEGNGIFSGQLSPRVKTTGNAETGFPGFMLSNTNQEYEIIVAGNDSNKFKIRSVTGSSDLLNIESGGNATFAGNVELGDSSNISMSNAAPGQLQIQGSGYTGAIALNATAMYIYHNSSLRDLVLGTNETARLTIDGSNGDATFAGDVVSNAIVQANGFRTTTGSTDYSLLTRNSSNTAVYIQQAGSGNILDVRYGSQAAGQGTSAFSVNSSGNATFAGNVRVNGWIKGASDTNTLFSNSSLGTLLQTPSNTGAGAVIHFRNSSGTDFQTFSQVDGSATFAGTVKGTAFLINKTSVAGIGASLGDINGAELGPGYLTLSRDDTADAKQILFEKNDVEHSYLQTTSSGLTIGGADVTFTGKIIAGGGVQFTGGSIATATVVLHTNNIIYFRGGTNGLYLQNGDGSDGYYISPSYHKWEANGSESMRLTSSGNLGIGTDSPDGKLQVTAASSTTSNGNDASFKLYLTNTDTTNNNYSLINFTDSDGGASSGGMGLQYTDHTNNYGDLCFITRGAGNYGERMRIDSAGNVGIGTTTPVSTLEISKSDQTNGATLSITNSFAGGSWDAGDIIGTIDFRSDDTSTTQPIRGQIKLFDDSASGSTYPFANAMSFSTAYLNVLTERMRIDSSGNVGIGTTNPANKLQVAGNINVIAPNPYIWIGESGSGGGAGFIGWNDASNYLYLGHSYGSAFNKNLVINDSGNVGIGTTSPLAPLSVVTPAVAGIDLTNISRTANNLVRFTNPQYSTNASMGLLLRVFPDSDARQGAGLLMTGGSDNAASNLSLFVSKDNGSAASQSYSALHIAGNTGNVGIGTTSPTYKLHIDSDDANDDVVFIHHDNATQTSGTLLKVRTDAGDSNGYTLLDVQTNNGSALFVRGDRNVGIGTNNPGGGLDIKHGSAPLMTRSTNNNAIAMYNEISGGYSHLYLYQINGAARIVLSTNGDSYFNGGDVGIGTTNPGAKLDINSPSFWINPADGSHAGLHFRQAGVFKGFVGYNDSTNVVNFSMDGSIVNGINVDSSHNVGIGTTTINGFGSDTVLAVYNATTPRIKLQNSTTGSANSDGGELNMSGSDFIIENREAGNIKIFNNGSERMRITSTGGISFGSTGTAYGTSGQVLTSAGNASPTWTTPTTGTVTGSGTSGVLPKWNSAGTGLIDSGLSFPPSYTYADLVLGSSNATTVRLIGNASQTGDFSIKNTTGDIILQADNTTGTTAKFTTSSISLNEDTTISGYLRVQGSVQADLYIGNVFGPSDTNTGYRINHSSLGCFIDVRNDVDKITYRDYPNSTGTINNKFEMNMSSGNFTATGNIIAFGTISDRKLKENIKPIDSALDKAMKLQGVTFNWKKSNSILEIREDIGFIAQDVQKVLPELVRENKNGEFSLRHQGITPILLEAIKELKLEVEELKKQIK